MKESQRFHDVLDYWHKIEFFIPFDLQQVFDTADEDALKWLLPADLASGSTSPLQVKVPRGRELIGFRLYVGIFEMQAISDFSSKLSASAETNTIEDDERTQLDGRSCIARVNLSAQGQPVFDPLSVSTVPWALGTASRLGLAALGASAFEAARQNLSDRLFNYEFERLRNRSDSEYELKSMPITAKELLALHELLVTWSGFELPPDLPVALLEIVTKEEKNDGKRPILAQEVRTTAATSSPADSPAVPDSNDEESDDEDDTAADEPTIDILNSFYIDDIEQCMASVREGDLPATLLAYLSPGDVQRRVDLYSDSGRAAIVQALHPTKMNVGHWPEDSSRKMSLMQQFAINTAFDLLKTEGLFSVNGPPGTGKTTLLRDMISENVVQRARQLSALTNAADALSGARVKIAFTDGNIATIRRLRPELTGFEMVVASSNNAAVENISGDLPKRKQLGDAWQGVRYLQPIAHKIAAQTGEKRFAKLQPQDIPWGLISCALGNRKNRRRFRERFFEDKRREDERGGSNDPRAVWDWIKQYSGPTYESARRAFLDADAAVRTAISERSRYGELHSVWSGVSEEQFTSPAADTLTEAERVVQQMAVEKLRNDAALKEVEASLADLKEEERLLDRVRPGRLAKLFRTEVALRHATDVAQNAHAQIDARRKLSQCRAASTATAETTSQAISRVTLAKTALSDAQTTWRKNQAQLADYRRQFGKMTLPGPLEMIETDGVQRDGFWQDPDLASLRSQLFVAALALHEAWFAEVAQTGGAGFGGNLFAIGKMVNGTRLENAADAELIWQSLFMVVPVVSTTFASFARQFRGMGPRSIGWLFIDEAGQAVPQAAVGALWRARRAMVVGDPLQIEPVFTVPVSLINALANLSPHTADGRYSPAKVSVQRLADDANPYGTYVTVDGEDPLWIGSPLRVHRRCVYPMFPIANRIAYQDKMVYGPDSRVPPDDRFGLGESAWIDVRGKTSEKQVVPAQIGVVVSLIAQLYAKSGTLPAMYVISPFKAVKRNLLARLQGLDWKELTDVRPPSQKDFQRWCRDRIGTVHTFQGKEESVVVFVLGADHDHAGSADWAAAKPNLLNVAVTRAQHRVFVVGDASLWGERKYFGEALSQLGKPISAEQWLARITGGVDRDREKALQAT
ncbi:AAA domain-containing protein [Paraburkholderia caffeinilytica]|uniref:DEAD/DEAH box helicase n=1 Tax=Paraburkholderia caffeinilytica TaxID=1761016 RepID=UPI003DA0C0CA